MSLGSFLFGRRAKTKKLPTMTPEQQKMLSQLLGMLGPGGQLGQAQMGALGQLTEMMDPTAEAYQRFAQPYLEQFEQQTVPGLAERFAGAGRTGMGALASSGFGQALGGAGAGLQTQLAGLKSQLQQGAIKDIMGQYQALLQPALGAKAFGYQHRPGSTGIVGPLLAGYAAGGFPGLGGIFSGGGVGGGGIGYGGGSLMPYGG